MNQSISDWRESIYAKGEILNGKIFWCGNNQFRVYTDGSNYLIAECLKAEKVHPGLVAIGQTAFNVGHYYQFEDNNFITVD